MTGINVLVWALIASVALNLSLTYEIFNSLGFERARSVELCDKQAELIRIRHNTTFESTQSPASTRNEPRFEPREVVDAYPRLSAGFQTYVFGAHPEGEIDLRSPQKRRLAQQAEKLQEHFYATQNPVDCSSANFYVMKNHGAYGFGSVLQMLGTSFLESTYGGFVFIVPWGIPYASSKRCASSSPFDGACGAFRPLTRCTMADVEAARRTQPAECATGMASLDAFTKAKCRVADGRIVGHSPFADPWIGSARLGVALEDRIGLDSSFNFGSEFFLREAARFITRPSPALKAITIRMFREAFGADARFDVLSRVIAVHVRHGDDERFGRRQFPSKDFSDVVLTKGVSEGWYDSIFVCSNDGSVYSSIEKSIASVPQKRNALKFKAHQIPTHFFVAGTKKNVLGKAGVMGLLGDQESPDYDELTVLASQVFISAMSGGFVGTIEHNLSAQAYLLSRAAKMSFGNDFNNFFALDATPFATSWIAAPFPHRPVRLHPKAFP